LSKLSLRSTKADSIATARLSVETSGEGFFEITGGDPFSQTNRRARRRCSDLFTAHLRLVVQENADPDVRADLVTALRRLAPANAGWVHDVEGPDDMPAHVKSMLNGVSLQIPVNEGDLALGAWQGIYVAEHRTSPHRREVVLQFCGSCANSDKASD